MVRFQAAEQFFFVEIWNRRLNAQDPDRLDL